jgi:hypothetical protein
MMSPRGKLTAMACHMNKMKQSLVISQGTLKGEVSLYH